MRMRVMRSCLRGCLIRKGCSDMCECMYVMDMGVKTVNKKAE